MSQWPEPLAKEAFYGLAGDFVRIVEPHTEADPAALLVQFLTSIGSAIGRKAHYRTEADRHFTNLFSVLVGKTSKGRKGTSHGRIKQVFADVDTDWVKNRNESGLSSGEGLIWAVRDAIPKREPIREKDGVTGYRTVEFDTGVVDKRLLVVEPEFSSVLRVMERDGNTLSPVLRHAWDDGDLSTLTKQSPARATGAHISILGHITVEELRRYLIRTEIANGFGNRFLWVCVQRSKVLPEGGSLQEEALEPIARQLKNIVSFAIKVGELQRDDDARAIWREVYPKLSEGNPGLYGAITARSEAQVVRLSVIYALLDRSAFIRKEHLLAGIGVWDYCDASASCIFGDALGDPIADTLYRALKNAPQGLTRTEINDLFGRNLSAAKIGQALGVLLEHGRVRFEQEATGGRAAERWYAVVNTTKETNKARVQAATATA